MKNLYIVPIMFGILCIGALFVNSSTFTDSQIFPKWIFAFAGLGVIGSCLSVLFLTGKKFICNIKVLIAIIVMLCVCQAGYGILQFCNLLSPISNTYKVTGSFDNPAGFAVCLCVGLPCTIYFLLDMNTKSIRWSSWIALLIISIGILMSESRTGLLCIVIVVIVHLICYNWRKIHGGKSIIGFYFGLMLFFVSTVFLITSIYQWKKDSADGRLLIWECSWEMIKDKPIVGHGIGAFEAHYMEYQASYFERHPDSKYTMLADNVKHPFNEFLLVGVQLGVGGWIIMIILCMFLFYCYKRHPSTEGYTALLTLLAIAIFSFFSYPFSYPFTWIIVAWCIGVLIMKGYENIDIWKITGMRVKRTMVMTLLVASLLLLYGVTRRTIAELEWRKISSLSLKGQTRAMLPRYNKLLSVLEKEPYFLYNYAAELYVGKRYQECLKIASDCRNYWADYDLEILQAETYISLKRYEEAEIYLKKAALMCPVRFVPLYRLHYIYEKQGNEEKADSLARLIIDKPVKVNSAVVRKIKWEMRSLCSDVCTEF